MSDPEEPSLLLRGRIPLASLIQTLAVAEYLNFRHAANALGMNQSTVSIRIKTLEQDLGVLLFERLPRGVRLTPAGRHFVEQITAGIGQLDHAVKTAGMLARGDHGQLRIGVHALIPDGFLAALLNRYHLLHPGIDVEIAEGTARDMVKKVRAEELDLTFVAGTPDVPDCHSRPVWSEALLAAVPEQHTLVGRESVTWADLVAEHFVVRLGGTGPQVYDHIILRLAGRWNQPAIQRFDVGRGTLMSMVAQDYGVTIASEATSQIPAPGVVFLPILDEPEPITFSAVWLPQNRSPALTNLLNLAKEAGRAARAV
ncbi:LysR family transcriptional regulator [Rhizobiaceae bacterium BDR2-2]|uniref:LysR family transcriptional regulator n=1 Tax=Ectorhizobium quercum TaxID=2965071 RepID=A0AAE3N302_9HYPH|nr:LysR family transcriptional regulator [Ectorhizobium quercum]MCX8999928.1 LysR family transcriptional regulator [Ectorhizobium quercum]